MNDAKRELEKIVDEIIAKKQEIMDKETKALIKQQVQDRYKLPLFKTERFNHWPYY